MNCYVDDIKASYVDNNTNDEFCKWAEKKYGSDEISNVTVTRRKPNDHLGIILDFKKNHHVGVDMTHYQEAMGE